MVPLSPPDARTLSSFKAKAFITVLWSSIVLSWSPSGCFQILILSEPAEAKECSVWWLTKDLIPFLCWVRHLMLEPFLMSQKRIILSWEPVMIWGSSTWQMMSSTVLACPPRTWTAAFVLMSQTLAVESLPPVTKRSSWGCKARA